MLKLRAVAELGGSQETRGSFLLPSTTLPTQWLFWPWLTLLLYLISYHHPGWLQHPCRKPKKYPTFMSSPPQPQWPSPTSSTKTHDISTNVLLQTKPISQYLSYWTLTSYLCCLSEFHFPSLPKNNSWFFLYHFVFVFLESFHFSLWISYFLAQPLNVANPQKSTTLSFSPNILNREWLH